MQRKRARNSSRRKPAAAGKQIDLPALVVSTLTLCSASLFVTLLLQRPEPADLRESTPAVADSMRANPPVGAPPVDLTRAAAPAVALPPVEAPPPEASPRIEPNDQPLVGPSIRSVLDQLGVKCAEGANCYPE